MRAAAKKTNYYYILPRKAAGGQLRIIFSTTFHGISSATITETSSGPSTFCRRKGGVMIVLKGDTVELKTGETGIVIDSWGIARNWIKVDTGSGYKVICMTSSVKSIVKRSVNIGKGAKK
jgi:hypothetical protein